MAPRKADDCHINKRIAAAGCRLPTILPAGEILTDITKKEWILGSRLGSGGFGDIYLASDDTTKPVGQNAKYVIKIEPHENGPLFVEMNFYIRSARQHMIKNWCDSQRKTRIGIPTYEGSGSHVYQKERFRFLVIPRYGIDVGKIFESRGRKLSTKFVNSLAIQMLDALEYIHSRGYAHSDVKGSNIILDIDQQKTTNPRANLVDYGLAYRFKTSVGLHKPFVHDERRAHEGTLEFTSRDAHHGTHSRRGDIETLGYNILQWMCGKLPWEQKNGGMAPSSNPDDIHMKKEHYLSDISLLMKECFLEQKKKPPLSIIEYFKHIVSLNFESKPNYNYLRNLFTRNGKIEKTFMTRKRVADENIIYPMPIKKPNLRDRTTKLNLQLKDRKPCKPLNIEGRVTRTQTIDETEKFCWEEVLAGHPDKLAKISAQPIYTDVDTLTPPPSPPPSPSFSSSTTPSRPTYAMVQIIKKIKERQTNGYKPKSKSYEDSKPKWMTPAMEEISRLKKKLQTIPTTKKITFSPRLTRSRVANNNKIKKKSISNNKVSILTKKKKKCFNLSKKKKTMGSSEMTGGVDSDGSVSWEDFFGTSTDLVPQLLGMFDELARKDQFNNNINDQIPSSIQKRLSLVAVNSQRNTIFGQICTGKMEQSQSSAMQQQQQQQQQQHQQQNHDINCIIPSLDKRSSPFSPLLLPSRRAPPPPPPPPPLPPLPHNSSCSITSSTVSFLYPKVEITVSDNNNNENEIKNSQNNNNNEKNHTILNDNNNNNNEDDIDNVDEDDNHEDDDDDDDKNINKLTTPKYGGRRKNNNNNIINNNNNNNGNIDRPLSGSSISSSSTSSSGCSNQGTTRSVNPYLTSVESLADTCASSQGSGDSGVVTKSDTNCRIINDDNLIVSSSHITTMNSSPQFMFHRARYCDPQRNSVEKVLLEIVDTEAIYVEHIRQIIQGYLIYWRNNKITLLNDNELNNLFSNIEDIYKFNYKFLGEIENCGLDPVKVANIFIKNNSGFKVYTEYCTNYPRTVETLTNLMGHDDTANEFRERQASLCHALPLGSFLLKPVQRILKYHLLLESLSREYDTLKINNQNNNNINYDNDIYLKGQKSIDDALNGMMDIAKHINAMKRKHEHAVRVQEIQSLLYGWAGPDLTTYGELIAEGRFRMRGAKAPRHAFLFDKMLLLTKKKEDGLLVYKAHIMCSNLMLIESIPGEACSFHVIPFDNPRLQYTLQARNTEQKREWTLQIKRVMLENYNAVIPVHAQELVLQIGQNQNNNDNINTNCDKISMKKQYSSPPEYLERRKQDKERRRSEAGQKIKKLLKTETADNSPLSTRKLTIDNNDNDNDNNNLHDKSLNRSLDSRSSKVKDRFTNWRRKSEPGFQSYISLNQSDDEHTDNNNNNNINDDIEVAMDALNYDDVIDNNDKQNDDDDDDNNNNKNNTKDTNEQINNNNNNNNSSRTVEEIVGHILYMQNKKFQKLLEKQRNNSMTNNVRQQRGYNKNHNSIDTSDDSDNPETDISSINNSLLSINKQNNKKNIKRTIRKDKRLLKSNNCWNSLESSTQNKYNNLQKNDNNNNNTQIIDNNNIVNIKKNNVTEKKQIFESFKKQNIITDSKIIKTALRIRDNSLYDDDDDDEDEDEDEEEDDDNNMTNSDLSLTNKSFGNYDNLENIWNNYDNKKQDTNSPTAIWLTKLCDDLPTSPQKCGSLPRSFQINPSSQMMITKRLLQRDGKPMSERPFTIASDKPAEINLEDMERYATTYQPKDIIAKFPLSSSSTITCSYSIDDNLTDANHMKVIETDIHPDHKIYRENNNNNNNNNKFKNVLTKASNRLQVLRSTVSAETLEIIDDYNNTKLTKRNNNNKEKNKKNKFKLSRESSIDDIDETNLSTINLQHSSLYYKQGSSCLGARIAQSDYADPSVLFFDLKKINLSTNESTNSNNNTNNIIETKITTNANDKNDNSIDDVDVKKINERNPSETDSFYERCFEKIENYADNIADTSYVVDADVDTDDVFRDSAIFSDIDDSNLIVKNNKTFNDNIIKIKTKITQPTPPPVPIKIRKSKPCIARKPDNLKMKVKVIKKCELVPPQCVRVKVSSTNQSQSGNVGKLINGGSVDEISAGQSQAGWVKKIVGQLQGQN